MSDYAALDVFKATIDGLANADGDIVHLTGDSLVGADGESNDAAAVVATPEGNMALNSSTGILVFIENTAAAAADITFESVGGQEGLLLRDLEITIPAGDSTPQSMIVGPLSALIFNRTDATDTNYTRWSYAPNTDTSLLRVAVFQV